MGQQGLQGPPLHRQQDAANAQPGHCQDEWDRRLEGEQVAAGQGQGHQEQGPDEQHPAEVVNPRLRGAPVGQPHQGDEDDRALRNIEPEDPAPAGKLDDYAAVGGAEHGAGLGSTAHHAEGQGPPLGRYEGGGESHAEGDGGATTDCLDDPGADHELEALGQGHQAGADAEDHQRGLVDPVDTRRHRRGAR